jgi:hypothetical protein
LEPIPVISTKVAEVVALLLILRMPVVIPCWIGVKVTGIARLPPGSMGAKLAAGGVKELSVLDMPVTKRAAVPVF